MSLDIFIDPESEISVKFWIAKDEVNKTFIGAIDEDSKIPNYEYKEYTASFREPNFKDVSELSDEALSIDGKDGSFSMTMSQVRISRVIKLIKKWSFTGKDGKPINPNKESIERMNPVIALTMAGALEKSLGILNRTQEILAEELEDSE